MGASHLPPQRAGAFASSGWEASPQERRGAAVGALLLHDARKGDGCEHGRLGRPAPRGSPVVARGTAGRGVLPITGQWRFLAHQGLQLGTQLSTRAGAGTQLTQLTQLAPPVGSPPAASGAAHPDVVAGGSGDASPGGCRWAPGRGRRAPSRGRGPHTRKAGRRPGEGRRPAFVRLLDRRSPGVAGNGQPVSPVSVVYTARVMSCRATLSWRLPQKRKPRLPVAPMNTHAAGSGWARRSTRLRVHLCGPRRAGPAGVA